jgi:hypothetical protein
MTLNEMHFIFKVQVLGNDMDAFKKILSSSSLPSDYGGDGMSLKELTGNCNLLSEIKSS